MKRDSRNFTHVYVAKCGRFTKIGGSADVTNRIKGLGAEKRGAGRLIRAWECARAYEVEGTAIWLLAQDHERQKREWFLAPIKAAVSAVENAIEMVSAGNVAPFTKKRASRQKWEMDHEAYQAKIKALWAETEAWAAANPVAWAEQCERARINYEETMARLRADDLTD